MLGYRKKVMNFLDGKDWVELDQIALGCDISRTKAKQTMSSLIYSNKIEKDGERFRLISRAITGKGEEKSVSAPSPQPIQLEKQAEDIIDISGDDDDDDEEGQPAEVQAEYAPDITDEEEAMEEEEAEEVVPPPKKKGRPPKELPPLPKKKEEETEEEIDSPFDDIQESLNNTGKTPPTSFSSSSTETPDSPFKYADELQAEITESRGLNARMIDIEQKLDIVLGMKQKKGKKGKLRKLSKGKLKRFGKKKNRAIFMLGRDKKISLVKGELISGMIKVNENFYDGSALYTWLWEGKWPVYLIPEWSVRPLTTDEIYQNSVDQKTLIDSQVITCRAIQMIEHDKEEGGKKKINFMMIIGIVVIGAVVAFLLFGGKK